MFSLFKVLILAKSDFHASAKVHQTVNGNDENTPFSQDCSFNVKIHPINGDAFELPVSSQELVQELHQILMDREDTCFRTCFSLQFEGQHLDNFAELKTIEGLRENSSIKQIEEHYTLRTVRLHIRHVKELMRCLDTYDVICGENGASFSYLSDYINEQSNFNSEEWKGVRTNSRSPGESHSAPESPDSVEQDSHYMSSLSMFGSPPASARQPMYNPPYYCLPGNFKLSQTLQPLLPDFKPRANPCLLDFSISHWNPVPGPRKLKGDLLYLHVRTLENKEVCITASTRGFYVNQSTFQTFDPTPAPQKYFAHTLVELFNQLSYLFKKNFIAIQKKRCAKNMLERVPTLIQHHSWIVPLQEHIPDSMRADDAWMVKLGFDEHILGQTRDWNEELQTTKELPHSTMPQRLTRDRAAYKVHSDFIAAATKGAVAVVDGNIMPINPGEDSKVQMFIYNNMFFSLGFDVKDHYKEFGGDAAAFVACNHDLKGIKAFLELDLPNLSTLGTVVVDYRGYRVACQSIIPGILDKEQEESVVHGSIDFGKTIVTHPEYHKILEKVALPLKHRPHKILNKENEEVLIHNSIDTKGIIGNDGRRYVLDLLRTYPLDVNYMKSLDNVVLDESVRALGYPKLHPHCLPQLRPELIDVFVESRYFTFLRQASYMLVSKNDDNKSVDKDDMESIKPEEKLLAEKSVKEIKESQKDILKKCAEISGSLSESEFDIRFNLDAFSPGVRFPESVQDELEKERNVTKDASAFLVNTVIPRFVSYCVENAIDPIGSYQLVELLHLRGINIRYLGRVLDVIRSQSANTRLLSFEKLILLEVLTRSLKHIARPYLQSVETCYLSEAVSHFLNCFLSAFPDPKVSLPAEDLEEPRTRMCSTNRENLKKMANRGGKRRGKRRVNRLVGHAEASNWTNLSPSQLWTDIKKEAFDYYSVTFKQSSMQDFIQENDFQHVTLLYNFCSHVGIKIASKNYNYLSVEEVTFTQEDIINFFPKVKNIPIRATDGHLFLQTGNTKLQQGAVKEGYELIAEAVNLFSHVYGPLHQDIALCLKSLSHLNYMLNEYAEAVTNQIKAVVIYERCFGLEHPTTIKAYISLGLYCFANHQPSHAINILYRARYLISLLYGEAHPEIALLDTNLGLMLHSVQEFDLALAYLNNSLELNKKLCSSNSLNIALGHHLLSCVASCQGNFRAALQHEKNAFAIYRKELGEDNVRTKESMELLKHLTTQAVALQKKMNEVANPAVANALPALYISQPTHQGVMDMLNAVNGFCLINVNDVMKVLENQNLLKTNTEEAVKKEEITLD